MTNCKGCEHESHAKAEQNHPGAEFVTHGDLCNCVLCSEPPDHTCWPMLYPHLANFLHQIALVNDHPNPDKAIAEFPLYTWLESVDLLKGVDDAIADLTVAEIETLADGEESEMQAITSRNSPLRIAGELGDIFFDGMVM